MTSTQPWRIRLKACVDRADQATRIYTQPYVKIRQNGRAYYFKGTKLCRLIANPMRQGGVDSRDDISSPPARSGRQLPMSSLKTGTGNIGITHGPRIPSAGEIFPCVARSVRCIVILRHPILQRSIGARCQDRAARSNAPSAPLPSNVSQHQILSLRSNLTEN
jgi:hypothetical protein